MITEVVPEQRNEQARIGGLLTSADLTDDGDGRLAV
jgi:hypothetical protein